jgi:acyl-CoA thioesterase
VTHVPEPIDDTAGRAVIDGMLARDAFSRWLGVELVALQPGRCTLRMRVRPDMLNGFGVSHGGIVFSLADSAMAFACNTGEHVTVAVDNGISYPAAVHAGDELIAVAEEERSGGTLGFYRVVVRRADESVVALFRGTVYRTRRLHLNESTS